MDVHLYDTDFRIQNVYENELKSVKNECNNCKNKTTTKGNYKTRPDLRVLWALRGQCNTFKKGFPLNKASCSVWLTNRRLYFLEYIRYSLRKRRIEDALEKKQGSFTRINIRRFEYKGSDMPINLNRIILNPFRTSYTRRSLVSS